MARVAKEKQTKEQAAAIKAFKASSEVEDFYRYVAENNIRTEAYELMKVVVSKITTTKKKSRKTLQ